MTPLLAAEVMRVVREDRAQAAAALTPEQKALQRAQVSAVDLLRALSATPEQEALARIARHVESYRAKPAFEREIGFANSTLYLIGCIARDTLAEALPEERP